MSQNSISRPTSLTMPTLPLSFSSDVSGSVRKHLSTIPNTRRCSTELKNFLFSQFDVALSVTRPVFHEPVVIRLSPWMALSMLSFSLIKTKHFFLDMFQCALPPSSHCCDVHLSAGVSGRSRCDGLIMWSVTPATSSIAWWSLKERVPGVCEQERLPQPCYLGQKWDKKYFYCRAF